MFTHKLGTIRFVCHPQFPGNKTVQSCNKRFCYPHGRMRAPLFPPLWFFTWWASWPFSIACRAQSLYLLLFSDSAQDMQTMRLTEGINNVRRYFSPNWKGNGKKHRETVQIHREPPCDHSLARWLSILSPDNLCLVGAENMSSSLGTEMM